MPDAILYEHEDGRYAVNPVTTGDPGWHRRGPVDVSAVASAAAADDEAETFTMSKFASRSDRDAALLQTIASLRKANGELAAAAIVPDHMVLVPKEASYEMARAACRIVDLTMGDPDDERYEDGSGCAMSIWRAMVAAATKETP